MMLGCGIVCRIVTMIVFALAWLAVLRMVVDMTQSYKDDDRTNWFDDGILDSWRVKMACRGCMRQLHMRDFNAGGGDFETFCRSVSLLLGFYRTDVRTMLCCSILKAADMCVSLRPHDGSRMAEMLNDDIVDLFGVVSSARLVGWCSVCWVKGCTAYDLKALWKDRLDMYPIISAAMNNFEKLTTTRYSENDMKDMVHL